MSTRMIRLQCVLSLTVLLTGCPTIPADPTACPDLQLEFLKEPTAALALHWAQSQPSNVSGHQWGAVDRSGAERLLNVSFVPQTGWPVPADTRGLAFTIFAHAPDNFGFDPMVGIGVAYVLEYTLPKARCNMSASWDAHLSVTLPHGVCVAREGTPGSCTNNDSVYADFQLFSVDDPAGSMSVTGNGLTALKNEIMARLATPDDRARLQVPASTRSSVRKSRSFSGNFDVTQDTAAHVYVGVSAFLMKTPHGWACLNKCTNSPTDRLVDDGVFVVEGGTDGVVGVGMTRRR